MAFATSCRTAWRSTAALPAMTREHLPRAAARQFVEGDVQHWWLPHSGQGVRTRISDDRAWLAYAVAHYVGATGDAAVLDEAVPFLEGQLLAAGEHDSFLSADRSPTRSARLFEHCARALDASLAVGAHGLPLIGTGDWNDGMNRVGELGQGESVWLGWLLYAALERISRRSLTSVRRRARRGLAHPCHDAAGLARARGLGWRLVPPRLVRRRHAARVGMRRGMPDRCDLAILGFALRGGRPRACGRVPWRRSSAT